MAIRKFTYPLKGNNDVASIRTKELALEAFLNSLDLTDSPDDPDHVHDQYSVETHTHPASEHPHEQYMVTVEGEEAPLGPDIGDVWVEDDFGVVQEVWIYTASGWVALMGGGGGGGAGPHNRHPNSIVIYEPLSNVDQWAIQLNTDLASLDFEFVG